MTTANMSTDTTPMYQGDSTYTRCAWEVKVGNAVSEACMQAPSRSPPSPMRQALKPAWRFRGVTEQDLCVGDIWETSERRDLVSFTTALDQDTQFLVTRGVPDNPFQTSKCASAQPPLETQLSRACISHQKPERIQPSLSYR